MSLALTVLRFENREEVCPVYSVENAEASGVGPAFAGLRDAAAG